MEWWEITLIAVAVGVGALFLGPYAFGALYWPTPRSRIRKMLSLGGLAGQEVLVDLGAGFGGVLIVAAREYGARAVGVEIDPLKVLIARLKIRLAGCSHLASVRWGSMYEFDTSQADLITAYLSSKAMVRLAECLRAKSKPGARLVSHGFVMPRGWRAAASDHDQELFLYQLEGALG